MTKQNKFKKVVALDTIIFYPEHEKILKSLVRNPKIERVPLKFEVKSKKWILPENYELPQDANIIIWPSSLPQSFEGISPEMHEKLKTAQCWTEAGLRNDISAQNLYNRVKGADCILTCWTEIPDEVLDKLIGDGDLKAIFTWTHEFEHRLNVKKARDAGIETDCVPDYGTYSVAELVFDGLTKLINRNKKTKEPIQNEDDLLIGTLIRLFNFYRKSHVNERKTRRGQFSHQFHKIGRAQSHYGNFVLNSLDQIIPEKNIAGKKIGIMGDSVRFEILKKSLTDGFKMYVEILKDLNENEGNFYKFLSSNEIIIYDSAKVTPSVKAKIQTIRNKNVFDISEFVHYNEIIQGKTMGIIGLGNIGSEVARIAKQIGMNVKYHGPNEKTKEYEFVDLNNLLETSDFISLHVKAHKALNLISKDKIELIKEGSYFINTSDGNAIDQKIMTEKMISNKLYVALDVYQGLPTTKTLIFDDNQNGKIKDLLPNNVFWYRAGWKTQESVRTKTYKLLGHMIKSLNTEK